MNNQKPQPTLVDFSKPDQCAAALSGTLQQLLGALGTFERTMADLRAKGAGEHWPEILAAMAGLLKSAAGAQAVTAGALFCLIQQSRQRSQVLVPDIRLQRS